MPYSVRNFLYQKNKGEEAHPFEYHVVACAFLPAHMHQYFSGYTLLDIHKLN